MKEILERAWMARRKANPEAFASEHSLPRFALRVFHGPGEGGAGPLADFAIESFGDGAWVVEWEGESGRELPSAIPDFLRQKGYRFAVFLPRPRRGVPAEPRTLFGEPPAEGLVAEEPGDLRFRIRFLATKHPGLFLDHAPLRQWLMENMRDLRVLNTFAYTGSLSVAAGRGGAAHVTTLDLSKPTLAWAEENWALNGLQGERARFIFGDVFEWLPRLKRDGARFDCVILDPPSFSRGKKGTFSTTKDLERLHRLAMELLNPGGFLVTSINSAKVTRATYRREIQLAAKTCGRSFRELREIRLPESFPVQEGDLEADYLKGWILIAE